MLTVALCDDDQEQLAKIEGLLADYGARRPGSVLVKVLRLPSDCILICHRWRLSIHWASHFRFAILTPFTLATRAQVW